MNDLKELITAYRERTPRLSDLFEAAEARGTRPWRSTSPNWPGWSACASRATGSSRGRRTDSAPAAPAESRRAARDQRVLRFACSASRRYANEDQAVRGLDGLREKERSSRPRRS